MSGTADDASRLVRGSGGNVLLLSVRRLERLVGYSMTYEFEDVIADVTGADRVDIGGRETLEWCRRAYKLARYATGSARVARAIAPKPPQVELDRTYELFFPTFNHAYELYALAAVKDWRKRCRRAACFVSELWVHQLPEYLLEMLSEFDHVFLGLHGPLADVESIARRPCTFLPVAADVVRFAPYPDEPERAIDVCNIGRRSAVTHAALLELARSRKLFYYYDTVAASGVDLKQRTFQVQDAAEHRSLLGDLLKRTRFFISNRSRANQPEFTQGYEEISSRYFEGIAAGAILLGEPPDTPEFHEQLGWPDAVIRVPFDCADIGRVIADLEAHPQRLENISRANVRNAALRHDWLHRLRLVYDTLALEPTPGMVRREEALQRIAALAAGDRGRAAMTPTIGRKVGAGGLN